jgi:hypothetical protein
MSNLMIKLNNGLEVPVDEFISWSQRKQHELTVPIDVRIKRDKRLKEISDTSRPVITPQGIFDSVSSAALASNIAVDVLRKYLLNDAYPDYRYLIPLPEDEVLKTNKVLYNGVLRKQIKTPLGIFKNVNEAAKAHNFSADQIKWRIHSDKYPDFHRTDESVGTQFANGKATIVKKSNKRTVTPLGVFDTKVQAMKAHNLSRNEFNKILRYKPNEFYFLVD